MDRLIMNVIKGLWILAVAVVLFLFGWFCKGRKKAKTTTEDK